MRTWLGAHVLSIFCFSHPELLIFLSQLSLFLVNFVHLVLSGKQKGGSHMGGVQINELVSHSRRAEWEENPGFRVCQRITLTLFSVVPLTWSKLSIMDMAGEKQGQLWTLAMFLRPLSQEGPLKPWGAAGRSPALLAHGLRPTCRTPPGSPQHSGSASHRTPGSGYRPPASSLRELWWPLGRNSGTRSTAKISACYSQSNCIWYWTTQKWPGPSSAGSRDTIYSGLSILLVPVLGC